MSPLIIKVSKDGTSREFLFSKLGPITIGSDEKCEIRLEGTEGRLLEVKMSSGTIFVKEVGQREQLLLDNVIIPFREEVPYTVGKVISLAESRYQIQIQRGDEAQEPPPFFSDDYKKLLEDLKKKIKEKEELLFNAEKGLDKRRATIENMDSFIRTKLTERNKREVEVEFLNQKLMDTTSELTKKKDEIENESNRLKNIQEHLEKLKSEDLSLSETIVRRESDLMRLREDIDRHHKDLRTRKEELANLHNEEKKAQNNLLELKREADEATLQVSSETEKVRSLLLKSDAALREKQQIEIRVERTRQECSDTERQLSNLQHRKEELEKVLISESAKIQELGHEVERLEQQISKHKQVLVLEGEKERQLKKLNEELRIELIKVEEKLTSRKNTAHQLDFQNQDQTKKLNQLKVDIESTHQHLQDLAMEEKTQDLKILGLRQELEAFQKKVHEEKKALIASHESIKSAQAQDIEAIRSEIVRNKAELEDLNHGLELAQKREKELTQSNKALQLEKTELETKISALVHRKGELDRTSKEIIEHNGSLLLEKGRLENEISVLRIKLLDCEAHIRQIEAEAQVELENLRREERKRIEAERQIMLSEVEAFRQKKQIELDGVLKENEEKIHNLKIEGLYETQRLIKEAQAQASQIISAAMVKEENAVTEGTRRLNDVAQEVFEREQKANFRINEAQNYYEQKEREAEMLLARVKRQTQELVRTTETDIQKDLEERKARIKGYLNQRQIKGQKHIEALGTAQERKLKKEEKLTLQNLENIRRKEYKKIAKLKQEALSQSATVKDQLLKVAKQEKEQAFLELAALKKRQEQELAEAKKTFLEQLSSTKLRQQRSMEEELNRQKELFERSKMDRVDNATHAVISAIVSRTGAVPAESESLKVDIKNALEQAINGKSPQNQKAGEQILNYNPMKKKSVLPMIRKYTLYYAAPAAMALAIMLDVGSIRTNLIRISSDVLKQSESASDKFVENQREEWKEKYTFNPETTVGYKDTYTDNVLYTTDFTKVMENETFQNEWLLAVNDFLVTTLELSEDIAISFISSEGTMVKEMSVARGEINPQFLEVGINKLKELEVKHMGWLPEKITDADKLKKFMDYKKDFFNNYYKDKFIKASGTERSLATQEEPAL